LLDRNDGRTLAMRAAFAAGGMRIKLRVMQPDGTLLAAFPPIALPRTLDGEQRAIEAELLL
jgi:hypothetical protein